MARLTLPRLRRLAAGFPGQVAVETGTFEADTTRLLLQRFAVVHTVELSWPRFARCCHLLAGTPAVCHHGDSAAILPTLSLRYWEVPIFWYLDAHHIATPAADRWDLPIADGFPIWDELRAIAQRNQADRVVVDDVHAFGRREKGWETVTQQRLRHALPRIWYCRVLGDQWVAQLRAE
jgi:hypothetical protein